MARDLAKKKAYRKQYEQRPEVKARNREKDALRNTPERRAMKARKAQEWRDANPGGFKKWWLKRRYGLSIKQYTRMMVDQLGGCAICGQEFETMLKAPAVDHCHVGGRVRGLLCSMCNTGIGHMSDDPVRLRAAAEYLEKFNANNGAEQ